MTWERRCNEWDEGWSAGNFERQEKNWKNRKGKYITHKHTIAALECYLAHRIERGLGTELTAERFRGLSPATTLILTHKGSRFYLNVKRRINYAGETIDYLACDSLQAHITKLYKDAGIRQGSSHSGRRSFASNLLRNGASLDAVQQLLGHSELFASGIHIINMAVYVRYLSKFPFFFVDYFVALLVHAYHNTRYVFVLREIFQINKASEARQNIVD